MIAPGANVRVYLACGVTDTRIADHPINRIDELLPWNLQTPLEMA
ncbi:hypothetical protein C8J37_12314 [Rhizobium sp. PP-WC-1G-195]|nr:hypothetical protein C8J37_12314 [Rhizobium sp. PP-WC-1G-195]